MGRICYTSGSYLVEILISITTVIFLDSYCVVIGEYSKLHLALLFHYQIYSPLN